MSEYIAKAPALQIFFDKMAKFSDEYPEEGKFLRGSMLDWATAMTFVAPGVGSVAEALEYQINFRVEEARKHGRPISAAKFIEELFSLNPDDKISADIIMARLLLG